MLLKFFSLLIFCFIGTFFTLFSQIPRKGDTTLSWAPGYLDLHHINTGRGSAAYYVFPDGTTMLFDAGELDPTYPRNKSPRNSVIRPNESKHPYEWIAHYINQVTPVGRRPVINYAILSHFHDDHMGLWYDGAPRSGKGDFVLTGITGIAELIPVEVLLDRGYPLYNIPVDMKSREFEETMKNNPATYRYWKNMNILSITHNST